MDPRLYDLDAAINASLSVTQPAAISNSDRINAQESENTDYNAAIKASLDTFHKEFLRERGDFWENLDSPVREWAKETEPPQIKCLTCFDQYPANEIKYFVCGHSLCKPNCLQGFIKGGKPYCPFCKKRLAMRYVNATMELSMETFKAEEEKKRAAEEVVPENKASKKRNMKK